MLLGWSVFLRLAALHSSPSLLFSQSQWIFCNTNAAILNVMRRNLWVKLLQLGGPENRLEKIPVFPFFGVGLLGPSWRTWKTTE